MKGSGYIRIFTDGGEQGVITVQLAATVGQGIGPEVFAPARPHTRRPGRLSVIKAAQLAFGGSVLDCVLLDVSPHGVRLYFPTPTEVPALATLRLKDGESRTIRRRWQTGSQAGFESAGTDFPTA